MGLLHYSRKTRLFVQLAACSSRHIANRVLECRQHASIYGLIGRFSRENWPHKEWARTDTNTNAKICMRYIFMLQTIALHYAFLINSYCVNMLKKNNPCKINPRRANAKLTLTYTLRIERIDLVHNHRGKMLSFIALLVLGGGVG